MTTPHPPVPLTLAQARRAAQVMSSCARPEAVRLNRHFGLPYLHLGQDRYARLPDVVQALGTDVTLTLYTDRRGLTGWQGFALHTSLMLVTLFISADRHSALLPAQPATFEALLHMARQTSASFDHYPPEQPWQEIAARAARLTVRYFPALDDSLAGVRVDQDDALWLLRTMPVICALSFPALLDRPDQTAMRLLLHGAFGAPMSVIHHALADAARTESPPE